MTPELALLARAFLLGLVVLVAERFAKRRALRRSDVRRTVVRLPEALNPVVRSLPGRPLGVSVVEAAPKPASPATGHLTVVKLEPRETPYVSDKRAA